MRKNILLLMATVIMGMSMMTSCSKKSVVPPKQTAVSNASAKPGSGSTTSSGSTGTSQNSGGYGCGNGNHGSQSPGG